MSSSTNVPAAPAPFVEAEAEAEAIPNSQNFNSNSNFDNNPNLNTSLLGQAPPPPYSSSTTLRYQPTNSKMVNPCPTNANNGAHVDPANPANPARQGHSSSFAQTQPPQVQDGSFETLGRSIGKTIDRYKVFWFWFLVAGLVLWFGKSVLDDWLNRTSK